MKQAIRVNISGVIFHIDEDAHIKLENYLKKLSDHYRDEPGDKEIIDDIESRICELFQEKLKLLNKNVISLGIVDEVLKKLGEPEEIIDEGSTVKQKLYSEHKKNRRLYRDPENAVIGGICSGFSAYLDFDVVWVRIIFVLLGLFNGFGILLYIILWIVVPAAVTRAQRLEMRGDEINLSNLEKDVRDEYDSDKKNDENMRGSRSYNRTTNLIQSFFIIFGNLVRFCAKLFLIFIGGIFIIVGFALLTAFFALIFFNYSIFPLSFHGFEAFPFHPLINGIISQENLIFILVSAFFIIAIPLIAIIYGGIKLLFKFKTKDRIFGKALLILWILSMITFITLILTERQHFKNYQKVHTSQVISSNTNKIYIDAKEIEPGVICKEFHVFDDEFVYYATKGDEDIYPAPVLYIEKSSGYKTEIILKKKSFGNSEEDATYRANNIIYHWELKDSLILLNPYYSLPEDNPWLFAKLEIIIKIPEGKTIFLSENLKSLKINADTDDYIDENDLLDKSWTMTDDGLVEEE